MAKTIEELIINRVEKAMGKACALIEKGAKEECPVRTGRLRNSISYEVERDGDTIIGIVKASAPYAQYVEYGTVKQKPQPFLRPALEKNKHNIDDIILEGIRKND